MVRAVELGKPAGALHLDRPDREPAWHAARAAQEAPLYLVIADLVLPLKPSAAGGYVATTCLARGSWSDDSRRRRNQRRRERRPDRGTRRSKLPLAA